MWHPSSCSAAGRRQRDSRESASVASLDNREYSVEGEYRLDELVTD
jgi:hypothetical protein